MIVIVENLFQLLIYEQKFTFSLKIVWYAPTRHKIGNISMSKISYERQWKIFGGQILEVYEQVSAFLRSELLSNSLSYG